MEYAPDWPIRTPGLLYDVNNFVPEVSGNYQTAPVLDPFTAGRITAGGVIGAATYRLTGESASTFVAGNTTKLYRNADGISLPWTDASSGTTYSVATNGAWTFATFGDALFAANGNSVLQYFTSGGSFVDLTGAPRAHIILEHHNALLALNIRGTNEAGWACSDTGDYTQWSAAPNNNADSGVFYGGSGPLKAGNIWGKIAVAWKANAMFAGIRVEEIDQAIRWDRVQGPYGCIGPFAQVKTELGLIFVSQGDILIYDGSKPRSIADKLRLEFLRQTVISRSTIFLTYDEMEKNVYFWASITTGGNQNEYPQGAYVFNLASGKWGKVSSAQRSGFTYDHIRCPVVDAVPADFYSTAFNYNQRLNLVVVESGGNSHVANMAHRSTPRTRVTASKPSFTTGYVGTANRDQTLSRLLIVPEAAATNPESGTIITVKEDANTYSKAASINDKGMVDQVAIGRYFQATVTWPTSTGKQTIAEMVPEFKDEKKGR